MPAGAARRTAAWRVALAALAACTVAAHVAAAAEPAADSVGPHEAMGLLSQQRMAHLSRRLASSRAPIANRRRDGEWLPASHAAAAAANGAATPRGRRMLGQRALQQEGKEQPDSVMLLSLLVSGKDVALEESEEYWQLPQDQVVLPDMGEKAPALGIGDEVTSSQVR